MVAVGDSGVIITRPVTGHEWTLVEETGTDYLLRDVAWSGERFVAVGDMIGEETFGYNVVVSADGLDWSARTASGAVDLYGILWNGERFVSVGEFGIIRTSP